MGTSASCINETDVADSKNARCDAVLPEAEKAVPAVPPTVSLDGAQGYTIGSASANSASHMSGVSRISVASRQIPKNTKLVVMEIADRAISRKYIPDGKIHKDLVGEYFTGKVVMGIFTSPCDMVCGNVYAHVHKLETGTVPAFVKTRHSVMMRVGTEIILYGLEQHGPQVKLLLNDALKHGMVYDCVFVGGLVSCDRIVCVLYDAFGMNINRQIYKTMAPGMSLPAGMIVGSNFTNPLVAQPDYDDVSRSDTLDDSSDSSQRSSPAQAAVA
jgi:hypothetical protein